MSARHDIETHDDVEHLVRVFYTVALEDPVIGFLFTDIAQLDLDHHIPRVTRFWETMILDADTYSGGVFRPHLELHHVTPLKAGHFSRWLMLWRKTVDELFAGPRAEQAKAHAERVARAFTERLAGIDSAAAQSGAKSTAAAKSGAGTEAAQAAGWSPAALQIVQAGAPAGHDQDQDRTELDPN